MKILVILFALGVSARPQVGPAGIVSPDGKNIQFSHEFANSIILTGPSGIVTSDGNNLQLTHGQASLNARTPRDLSGVNFEPGAVVSHSGAVNPSGNNVQFTLEQANDIVAAGPSGIVTRSGNNIQLSRRRRQANAGFTTAEGSVGIAGIVRADGTIQGFTREQMEDIILIGPGGVVTKSGKNYQLTRDLYIARKKRELRGPSGWILADGTQVQFKTANPEIVLEGPSGIIFSDGTLAQKKLAKRSLRDLNIGVDSVVGASGIVNPDGKNIQFTPEQVDEIAVAGPSGIVFKDGRNMQFS